MCGTTKSTFEGKRREQYIRDDRRDIIPFCVLKVNVHNYDVRGSAITIVTLSPTVQEIRSRYPSADGNYREYTSTFDADTDVPL